MMIPTRKKNNIKYQFTVILTIALILFLVWKTDSTQLSFSINDDAIAHLEPQKAFQRMIASHEKHHFSKAHPVLNISIEEHQKGDDTLLSVKGSSKEEKENLAYSWSIPNNVQIIRGAKRGMIGAVLANDAFTFDIQVRGEAGSLINLHVYYFDGHENIGLVKSHQLNESQESLNEHKLLKNRSFETYRIIR